MVPASLPGLFRQRRVKSKSRLTLLLDNIFSIPLLFIIPWRVCYSLFSYFLQTPVNGDRSETKRKRILSFQVKRCKCKRRLCFSFYTWPPEIKASRAGRCDPSSPRLETTAVSSPACPKCCSEGVCSRLPRFIFLLPLPELWRGKPR